MSLSLFHLQEASSTEISGWLVAPMHGKAEWKSIITVAMAQFAMTDGTMLMLKWCADSWDSIQKVRIWSGCIDETSFHFRRASGKYNS